MVKSTRRDLGNLINKVLLDKTHVDHTKKVEEHEMGCSRSVHEEKINGELKQEEKAADASARKVIVVPKFDNIIVPSCKIDHSCEVSICLSTIDPQLIICYLN